MIIIILVISIVINVVVGYGFFKAIKALDFYEEFFISLQEQLVTVLTQIRSVDLRGAFEADDEVGVTFIGIKKMIYTLGNFIENFDPEFYDNSDDQINETP